MSRNHRRYEARRRNLPGSSSSLPMNDNLSDDEDTAMGMEDDPPETGGNFDGDVLMGDDERIDDGRADDDQRIDDELIRHHPWRIM